MKGISQVWQSSSSRQIFIIYDMDVYFFVCFTGGWGKISELWSMFFHEVLYANKTKKKIQFNMSSHRCALKLALALFFLCFYNPCQEGCIMIKELTVTRAKQKYCWQNNCWAEGLPKAAEGIWGFLNYKPFMRYTHPPTSSASWSKP